MSALKSQIFPETQDLNEALRETFTQTLPRDNVVPFRPKRQINFDLTNHYRWGESQKLRSLYWRPILRVIAWFPNGCWGEAYIAGKVGCSTSTACRVTDVLAGLGAIEKVYRKRRNGWVCRFRILALKAPPKTPETPETRTSPRVLQHCKQRTKSKGLHPACVTPSSSSGSRNRAREAPAAEQEGQKPQPQAAKPADAGSEAPGERYRQFQQHQRWAKKNPVPSIKKFRWCRKLFHRAQNDLAQQRGNVTAGDVALLDLALYLARHGHWYHDLHPEQRRRVDELDLALKADPVEFELPEERRRRERLREGPLGKPAGGPVLTPAQARAGKPGRHQFKDPNSRARLLAGMRAGMWSGEP